MDELHLQHCVIDLQRGKVHRSDAIESLTTKEIELLRYLAAHPGELVTRDDLLVEVWGYAEGVTSRAADTAMRRLRTKVEADPAEPDHLTTVYGAGYRFIPGSSAPIVPPSPAPELALPNEEMPLIGRGEFLAQLDQLRTSNARLITLLGPGGMGKSRLALAHLHKSREHYPGGIWRIDTGDGLPIVVFLQGLCLQLGIQPTPETSIDSLNDQITTELSTRGTALLLTDNFDEDRDPILAAVKTWLQSMPHLHVLITCRARTQLPQERVIELTGLSPEAGAALFLERAQMLRSGFSPDAAEQQTIQELVDTLDGMPLAIEMAAGRIRLMSPEQLLIRLGQSYTFLEGSAPGSTARHTGVIAMMTSSWEALSDEERTFLMGCTVFGGGFSMAAAEAILQPLLSSGSVMNRIGDLMDSSWLRLQDTPQGVRFALYTTVRAFVDKQTGTKQQRKGLRDAHLQWFWGQAKHRGEDIEDRANAGDIQWLAVERANLLMALDHAATATPETHAGLLRVLFEEASTRSASWDIEHLLEHHPIVKQGLSPHGEARLRATRAEALRNMGRMPEALADVEMAVKLAIESGDPDIECDARYTACWISWDLRKLEAVEVHLKAMEQRAPEGQMQRWEVKRLFMRCYVGSRSGHLDTAYAAGKQALQIATARNGLRRLAMIHQVLGGVCRDLQDTEDAIAHTRQAAEVFAQIQDTRNVGYIKNALAMLYAVDGQFEQAAPLLDEALTIIEKLQEPHGEAILIGNRGAVHLGMAELTQADACLWKCLQILENKGILRGIGFYKAYLGATRALLGRFDKATRLMDEAEAALLDSDFGWTPGFMAAIRAHLNIGRARAAGQTGNTDVARDHLEAARLILQEASSSGESPQGVVQFAHHLCANAIARTEPQSA